MSRCLTVKTPVAPPYKTSHELTINYLTSSHLDIFLAVIITPILPVTRNPGIYPEGPSPRSADFRPEGPRCALELSLPCSSSYAQGHHTSTGWLPAHIFCTKALQYICYSYSSGFGRKCKLDELSSDMFPLPPELGINIELLFPG